MSKAIIQTKDYKEFIKDIKDRIQSAQIKAAVSVNREMLQLYWELGQRMIDKQQETRWGDGFIKLMSKDLQAEFPEMKGFSERNLKYMRQWVQFWSGHSAIGQQVAAQLDTDAKSQQVAGQLMSIPWWHHVVILSKIICVLRFVFKGESNAFNNS